MINIAKSVRIEQLFGVLFEDLSKTWSESDLAAPRHFVDHNEGGEALDELIAIGLKRNLGFSLEQIKQVEVLVEMMEMKDLLWVDELRRYQRLV